MDGNRFLTDFCCDWLKSTPTNYLPITFPIGLAYCHPGLKIPYVAKRNFQLMDVRGKGKDLVSMMEDLVEDRYLVGINPTRSYYVDVWAKSLRKVGLELDGFLFSETEVELVGADVKTYDVKVEEDKQEMLRKKLNQKVKNLISPSFL